MRDPFFRPFASLSSSRDSLLQRIRENLRLSFAPVRIFPSSANGAPLHGLRWEQSSRLNRAQSASLVTHAAIIAALLLPTIPTRHFAPPALPGVKIPTVRTPRDIWAAMMGRDPSEGRGSG